MKGFFYRKLRYETDLAQNKSWKLRYEDLHIQERGSQEIQTKGMPAFKREKRAQLGNRQIVMSVNFSL